MTMERQRNPASDLFQRAALDYYFGPGEAGHASRRAVQAVPVNVYLTADDVVITAPMPGVEADDIDIEVHGTRLRLRAALRGPHQMDRDYLVHEWTYGPYERVIELPIEVDASRANASHGNGVLVLSLPKAPHLRAVKVSLNQITSQTARHQGHSGRSTKEE
jgi:HSP20 family protein